MYAENREKKLVEDFKELREMLQNIEEDINKFKGKLQEISGRSICVSNPDLDKQINQLLESLAIAVNESEQFKYSKMVMGIVPKSNPLNSKLFINKFPKEVVEHYSKICPECNIRVFKRLPVCICGHVFSDVEVDHKSKSKSKLKFDPTMM